MNIKAYIWNICCDIKSQDKKSRGPRRPTITK